MRSIHTKCAATGLAILAAVTGCSSSPHSGSRPALERDLLGKFVWVMPPEIREEFELLPDGSLRWQRWNGHLAGLGNQSGIEARGRGRWRVMPTADGEGGPELWFDLDRDRNPGSSRPLAFDRSVIRLTVREYQGHPYLLRPNDLPWFEGHGPIVEFCLHRQDAPLEIFQPYSLSTPGPADSGSWEAPHFRPTER